MRFRWWRRCPRRVSVPHSRGLENPTRFRPVVERLETRALPSVQLISQALPGGPSVTPNGASSDASVSAADGRYVVFASGTGSNLVPGQTAGGPYSNPGGLFLYDRLQGTTTQIVSNPPFPGLGSTTAENPVISPDGRFVAFVFRTDQYGDAFPISYLDLYDRVTGATTGVATYPGRYSFSASGRFLVFASSPEPGVITPQPTSQVEVYDDLSGTTLVSHSSSDITVGGNASSFDPAISADGRYIAYSSSATDLVAGETVPSGTFLGIYLYDQVTGTTRLVSHDAANPLAVAVGVSDFPVLSGSGSFLAYSSTATDLVPGQTDTNGGTDVFLYDTAQGSTTLVSHNNNSSTTAANFPSSAPVISADGNEIAFQSSALDLIAGQTDTNASDRTCFLYDRTSGTNTLVSHNSASPTATGNASSSDPAISTDGSVVAYVSMANDLASGQTGPVGIGNVFVYSSATGTNTLVSTASGSSTMGGNEGSDSPVLSNNGTVVVFRSDASNLVRGDNNNASDVFAFGPPLVSPCNCPAGSPAFVSAGTTSHCGNRAGCRNCGRPQRRRQTRSRHRQQDRRTQRIRQYQRHLLGNGDGTFQPAMNYNPGGYPVSVVVADVNGDGKPDLVVDTLVGMTVRAGQRRRHLPGAPRQHRLSAELRGSGRRQRRWPARPRRHVQWQQHETRQRERAAGQRRRHLSGADEFYGRHLSPQPRWPWRT